MQIIQRVSAVFLRMILFISKVAQPPKRATNVAKYPLLYVIQIIHNRNFVQFESSQVAIQLEFCPIHFFLIFGDISKLAYL